MDPSDWFQYVAQIPTPPHSHDGSVIPEQDAIVSVSTTFFPGAHHLSLVPDLVLLSTDNVYFYVHLQVLLAASDNAFDSLLPPPPPAGPSPDQEPIVEVTETAIILNVILHCIYDMSCAHYSPSFEVLVVAANRLAHYGVDLKARICPSTPMYALLLSHAPLRPLDVYAFAASLDLYDLAVAASPHLLSFPLASLTDEMAQRIGPVYLKRLFFLHFGRADALKRVLLQPPHPHSPTPTCDLTEQKKLTRAWALASAYLAWDARPDLSTSTIESALRPLAQHLICDLCQQALRDRIKNLVVQWSIVKRTI